MNASKDPTVPLPAGAVQNELFRTAMAENQGLPEDEDADPVGTPVNAGQQSAGQGPGSLQPGPHVPPKPRNLEQEKQDFTAEGAPPPGKVAGDVPATPDNPAPKSRTGGA